MGARPMARVIDEQIKRSLANELLFGALVNGGHVMIIEASADGIELDCRPAPPRKPQGGAKSMETRPAGVTK